MKLPQQQLDRTSALEPNVSLFIGLVSVSFAAIFSETLSFSNWVTFAVILQGIYLAASSQSAVKATGENSKQLSTTA